MRPSPSLALAFAVACLVGAARAGADQTAATRLTPAQVALKTLNTGDALDASLAAALEHSAPGVRLVAARAVGAMGLRDPSLETALRHALDRETDNAVVVEIVRALLLLETPESLRAAEAYLDRANPRTVQVLAAWSGIRSASDLARRLPEFAARLGDRPLDWLRPVIMNAAGRDPSAREDLLRAALGIAIDIDWSHVLDDLSTSPGALVDLTIFDEALRSPRASIREATVWHLVGRLADGKPVAPDLLDQARTDPRDSDVTWERFGRELIDRSIKKTPAIDRAELIARRTRLVPPVRVDGSILTRAERSAFERLLRDRAQSALDPPRLNRPVVSGNTTARAGKLPAMRTVTSLWPGFLHELLGATGCKQSDDGVGAVLVTYARSGRPDNVVIDSKQVAEGCLAALDVLGHLTVRDDLGQALADERETLMLFPRAEIIACADEVDPQSEEILRELHDDPDIAQPRKIKDVRPAYPENAQSVDIQGTVAVRAVIAKSGCVRQASIVRSVYPALDFAALRAVSEWKFSPALLLGKPTEVTSTFSLVFRIRR